MAAEAFMSELDTGVQKISEFPEIRSYYVGNTRRYFFRHFPFAIIYRVHDETVQVVAVAHGRRKPGYWKNRQFG